MMLIMLAGLQSKPPDVLEAAKVDGATPFGIFRQLTLGHLRPYMELGILLGTIYLIQVYDQIAVITGGGPGSTNVPVLRLPALDRGRMGVRLGVRVQHRRRDRVDHHRDHRAPSPVPAPER